MSDRPEARPASTAGSRALDHPVEEAETVHAAFSKLEKGKPELISEMMAFMGSGLVSNPLHSKMEAPHITQLLELAADHDEREYTLHKTEQDVRAKEGTSNRRYFFATFLVVVLLFAFILIVFKDKPEILIPSLTGLGGLVGGFMGGWGFGKSKQ